MAVAAGTIGASLFRGAGSVGRSGSSAKYTAKIQSSFSSWVRVALGSGRKRCLRLEFKARLIESHQSTCSRPDSLASHRADGRR